MDKPVMQSVSISRQKKILILLVLCLVAILVYLNSRLLPIDHYWTSKSDLPIAKEYPRHKMKEKVILYWNTFFGSKDMSFGIGNSIFKKCNYSNCIATFNRSFLPIEQFDAIIFHGPRYFASADGFPKLRSVHQKYIFYSLESPFNIEFDDLTQKDFYNLSMTYRRDSDIYEPYGLLSKSDTNYEPPAVEEIRNRTKKVAWFVSNCHTYGSKRRMKYASELAKYIPVDIFGSCGTLTCKNRSVCYKMLEQDYKFYLSFENSMCKDYVTEKLFNILKLNVIPVVLGFFSYDDVAPPNSVINTNDFKSPKNLAEYLLNLDQNTTEYLKYFEWKKYYVFEKTKPFVLCQICRALNMPLRYSTYEDIREWFIGFKCVL